MIRQHPPDPGRANRPGSSGDGSCHLLVLQQSDVEISCYNPRRPQRSCEQAAGAFLLRDVPGPFDRAAARGAQACREDGRRVVRCNCETAQVHQPLFGVVAAIWSLAVHAKVPPKRATNTTPATLPHIEMVSVVPVDREPPTPRLSDGLARIMRDGE